MPVFAGLKNVHGSPEGSGHLLQLQFSHIFQEVPRCPVLQKAGSSRSFYSIGKSIQADKRCTVSGQPAKIFFQKALSFLCLHVKVDLFLSKSTPDCLLGLIPKLCHNIRCSGLPLINSIRFCLGWHSIFPKILIANKQSSVWRLILFL